MKSRYPLFLWAAILLVLTACAPASIQTPTTTPPPAWNFHPVPVVQGRAPLWESGDEMPVATGLATDKRHRAGHEPAAEHSIELTHTARGWHHQSKISPPGSPSRPA